MIIIREKNSKRLASVIATKENPQFLYDLTVHAKVVDVIYYEKGIQITTFSPESESNSRIAVHKLIGELERINAPFILALDKKCTMTQEPDFLTLINAECISRDLLTGYFKNPPEEKTSSNLFHDVVAEYLDFHCDLDFKGNIKFLTRHAIENDILGVDVLFITFDGKTGDIYNTNKSLGNFDDNKRIWYFNEIYDYAELAKPTLSVEPAKDNQSNMNMLEEFSAHYETPNTYVGLITMSRYNQYELTEIITKYPQIFSDFVKKRHSYFDPEFYNRYYDIHTTVEEEEDIEEEMDEFDEYFSDAADVPVGMRLCFSCDNSYPKNDTALSIVEGKKVYICNNCSTPSQNIFDGMFN